MKTNQTPLPGDIIASLRIAKRIPQQDFAEDIGVTPSYLSSIENNHKHAGPKLLRKIAHELEIPFEEFALMLIRDRFPRDEIYDEVFSDPHILSVTKSFLEVLVPT